LRDTLRLPAGASPAPLSYFILHNLDLGILPRCTPHRMGRAKQCLPVTRGLCLFVPAEAGIQRRIALHEPCVNPLCPPLAMSRELIARSVGHPQTPGSILLHRSHSPSLFLERGNPGSCGRRPPNLGEGTPSFCTPSATLSRGGFQTRLRSSCRVGCAHRHRFATGFSTPGSRPVGESRRGSGEPQIPRQEILTSLRP